MNSAFTLPALRGPPPYLRDLFTGGTAEARQFQKNLQALNCTFAFTLIGCNIDQRLEDQGGIQPFAIHGQLSHYTGPLEVADGAHGRYAQLYIIDTERAINERMQNNQQLHQNPHLNQQMVEQITHMLHECQNPFIDRFKTAYQRLQEAVAADPTVNLVTIMDC
jgi:hypothetical protein